MAHQPGHVGVVAAALLSVALVTSTTGCRVPLVDDTARVINDVAVSAGLGSDEARALVQTQADQVGASADDVARGWRTRLQGAGAAYRSTPEELRGWSCEIATGWLSAVIAGDPWTEGEYVTEAAGALAALNANAGARQLGRDLAQALDKRDRGEPYAAELAFIKAGTCLLVSQ